MAKYTRLNRMFFNRSNVSHSKPVPPVIVAYTKSHKGQILPLKNRVIPVDNNTVFLAHYDITVSDVLYGIEPLGTPIYKLQDGYFGNGVSINDANAETPVGKLLYLNLLKDLSEYTVSCWFTSGEFNPSFTPILTGGGTTGQYLLAIHTNKIVLWGLRTDTSTYNHIVIGNHPDLTINTWYHATVVCRGSEIKIYLNGSNVGTSSHYDRRSITSHLMGVGCEEGSPNRTINGMIDELRIDKVARSDDEILAWYYSNSPFYPKGIYKVAY